VKVLFVDMAAPSPYTANTLRSYALGGTEATVIRVARGLSKLPGYSVFLFQGCDAHRTEGAIDGIFHCNELTQIDPDVVVHLRTALFVEGFKEEYPKARHIVWLHDNLGVKECLEEPFQGCEVVCVSDWHADTFLKAEGGTVKKVHRIYNPVEVDAERQPKVKGRLGFFSSPHKGLSQILASFYDMIKDRQDLELVVGNPGYMPDLAPDSARLNVRFLGQLPHRRVLEELSKCEMLFYPQTVFPETMGLVMAEANAMGTPVLCHDFGAAMEVLTGTAENTKANAVADCSDASTVKSALTEMLSSKTKTEADPRFAIDAVVAEWKKLLEGKC
jgi:glycosyltransferase involved in cell wall biosynthesis